MHLEDEVEAMNEDKIENVVEIEEMSHVENVDEAMNENEAKDMMEIEDADEAPRISRTKTVVRIAHYSVQEYLESDRNKQSKAAQFSLHHLSAHEEIAKICLIYLIEPELSSGKINWTKLREFPLARFAARFWPYHYKKSARTASSIDNLILQLLRNREGSLLAWLRLYNVDEHIQYRFWHNVTPSFDFASSDIASPLYYASLLGLDTIVRELLQVDAAQKQNLVNAKGGREGNPLLASIFYGYEKTVQILLDAGANVNVQGGHYGNALQAASYKGHEKIVQLLLNTGANVNVQGGFHGNALYATSSKGHEKIVQILIDEGIDKKWWGGALLKASENASENGSKNVVRLLINAGVDKSFYNDAMQRALRNGNKDVVEILAAAGAAKKRERIQDEKNNTENEVKILEKEP